MIDLHLHTTASDGRCTPEELVDRAAEAGVSVLAVTDHDTTAAIREVAARARRRGIEAVSGIEITAIADGRDVHVLGYFFDPADELLAAFLATQRAARVARVEAIAARLEDLGMPVDVRHLIERAKADPSRSIGRPQIARAMVEAGYAVDTRAAFDKWLGRGLPAFIARAGVAPDEVIQVVHRAGGLASLAHPGKTDDDDRIAFLRDAGLDALEAFHPDHDAAAVERYVALARELGLLLTGGSDFHGDPAHGPTPGFVTLPSVEWARLRESAQSRRP